MEKVIVWCEISADVTGSYYFESDNVSSFTIASNSYVDTMRPFFEPTQNERRILRTEKLGFHKTVSKLLV